MSALNALDNLEAALDESMQATDAYCETAEAEATVVMSRMADDLARSGLDVKDVPHFEELDSDKVKRLYGHRAAAYKIPYLDIDGNPIMVNGSPFFRLRFLDNVTGKDGKNQRYWTAPGDFAGGVHVYIPQNFVQALREANQPVVVITEGEKKAESACKAGIPCVALPGIWMFQDMGAKAQMHAGLLQQGHTEADVRDYLSQHFSDVPVSPEIIALLGRAREIRPMLHGVLVLYDSDGCPLSDDHLKQVAKKTLILPKETTVYIHSDYKNALAVLNRQVTDAAYRLAESLRLQLPGEWCLPVLDAFCPLRIEAGKKDETPDIAHKQGLDDWIVASGASAVADRVMVMSKPIADLQTLVQSSPLLAPRVSPAKLSNDKDSSPEQFAMQLTDTESVGFVWDEAGLIYRWDKTFWRVVDGRELSLVAGTILDVAFPAKMAAPKLDSIKKCILENPRSYQIPPIPQAVIRLALLDTVLEIDSRTGEMRETEPAREQGLRHCIDVKWADREQPTPLWDKFIAQVLPDAEVRELVLEYIGYTLTPTVMFQVAQVWIGGGANGKSALASIVEAMHRKVAALDIGDLSGFSAEGIIGASLVTVDEMPSRVDEQKLKNLIGGDTATIPRKYLPNLSYRPTAKWIMRGNNPPSISDQSDGFWRRQQIIPFTASIPEEERDATLPSRIIEGELAGVLYRHILPALGRLLTRGGFGKLPAAMQQAKADMRQMTNSILGWIAYEGVTLMDEKCPTERLPRSKQVYEAYAQWCKASNLGAISVQKFWGQLANHLPGAWSGPRKYVDQETGQTVSVRLCNVRAGSDAPAAEDEDSGTKFPGPGKVVQFRPLKDILPDV